MPEVLRVGGAVPFVTGWKLGARGGFSSARDDPRSPDDTTTNADRFSPTNRLSLTHHPRSKQRCIFQQGSSRTAHLSRAVTKRCEATQELC